jgi:hypothetical protein
MPYGSGAWGGRRDPVPPTFAGITALDAATVHTLTAHWAPATDDITPQPRIVYDLSVHAAAGQDFELMYSTDPGETSFVIPDRLVGTPYFVVVRARDEAQNRDENTVELSASTLDDTTPPVFGGLDAAVAVSGASALLSWDPASDDNSLPQAIEYDVYVSTTPGGQNFLDPPAYISPPGATVLAVGGLSPNTTYYFVVRARDEAGNRDANTVERSADTGFDSTPPTVVYDPPSLTDIARFDHIGITVTDDQGAFRRVIIIVTFEATGACDVVHDGVRYKGLYAAESSRTIVPGGFAYDVARFGGWPATPSFEVFAIDLKGNEAE